MARTELRAEGLLLLDEMTPRLGRLREIILALGEIDAPVVAPPANDAKGGARFFRDGEIGYARFFDWLRGNRMLGPKISAGEFQGCDLIISAFGSLGAPIAYVAYGLATAYHETAATMQPIHEIGSQAYFTRLYDIKGSRPETARKYGNTTPGDGARYPGRGFVQLTWKRNYAVATAKLRALGYNVDLVAEPDRAMEPEIAAVIMASGMIEGWFTARKLGDDLPESGPATLGQFVKSRDIINGVDKDDEIAVYANDWQTALQHGGYLLPA